MQGVRLAHDRRHTRKQALLLLWHLLHVVAFAECRFVAVDMIDADAIRCGREQPAKACIAPGPIEVTTAESSPYCQRNAVAACAISTSLRQLIVRVTPSSS